jgi:hypothetical protein
MTTPIDVDMDKECGRCHEKGACKNGLCMKCIADSLKKNKAIGWLTMQKAKVEICNMLDEYHKEIDEAYVKADGDLNIPLGLKMAGTRMAGDVELTVSINFVESRIKHAVKLVVNEKQMSIPGVE